jgi:hypothetical protein
MQDEPPHLVSKLIDVYSATWDKEKLQKFFLPMDREIIS